MHAGVRVRWRALTVRCAALRSGVLALWRLLPACAARAEAALALHPAAAPALCFCLVHSLCTTQPWAELCSHAAAAYRVLRALRPLRALQPHGGLPPGTLVRLAPARAAGSSDAAHGPLRAATDLGRVLASRATHARVVAVDPALRPAWSYRPESLERATTGMHALLLPPPLVAGNLVRETAAHVAAFAAATARGQPLALPDGTRGMGPHAICVVASVGRDGSVAVAELLPCGGTPWWYASHELSVAAPRDAPPLPLAAVALARAMAALGVDAAVGAPLLAAAIAAAERAPFSPGDVVRLAAGWTSHSDAVRAHSGCSRAPLAAMC
jgi:hypothetical protein